MVPTADAPPIPLAATVVLLRDGDRGMEVLMLRRRRELRFYGGAWVFPGGRIETADYPHHPPEDHDQAARVGAVREVLEETGMAIRVERLHYFARWLTPPGRPRRFDTYYFISEAPHVDTLRLDVREADAHRFERPAALLHAHSRDELELPPPTFVTLTTLAAFRFTTQALNEMQLRAVTRFTPKPLRTSRGEVHLYEGDAGYQADDPLKPGARHRLLLEGRRWAYVPPPTASPAPTGV